jgi:hypothetical protein
MLSSCELAQIQLLAAKPSAVSSITNDITRCLLLNSHERILFALCTCINLSQLFQEASGVAVQLVLTLCISLMSSS